MRGGACDLKGNWYLHDGWVAWVGGLRPQDQHQVRYVWHLERVFLILEDTENKNEALRSFNRLLEGWATPIYVNYVLIRGMLEELNWKPGWVAAPAEILT